MTRLCPRPDTLTRAHTLWQIKDEGRDPAERGFAKAGKGLCLLPQLLAQS